MIGAERIVVPGLQFDDARHLYTLDGKRVPGVTTILKPVSGAAYEGVDPAIMEAAAALGRAVHLLIELDCAGELDTDNLDPELLPYYWGWREFLGKSGFQPLMSEQKLASSEDGYAGMLDLFGILNGVYALIDAKRVAMVMKSTGPQTFGYAKLLRRRYTPLTDLSVPLRRYALHLKKPTAPGKPAPWALVPFNDDRVDALVFQSCLNIARFNLGML